MSEGELHVESRKETNAPRRWHRARGCLNTPIPAESSARGLPREAAIKRAPGSEHRLAGLTVDARLVPSL